MSGPKPGDLVIRSETDSNPPRFIVVDALTHRLVSGPFPTLTEATTSAAALVDTTAAIWGENVDHRGRPLGPLIPLPIERR